MNGASVTRPQVRPGGGRQTAAAGFSFVELMLVAGVMATMSLVAIGTTRQAVERYRTAGAARYLAGRLQQARSDAVARGASVALRFSPPGDPVTFSVFVDGNRNGVLSSDIAAGVDTEIAAPTDLSSFAGVSFGVIAGVVSPEGEVLSGDPIHCGAARMASFTTRGTATSGSFYIRGKTEQFVVRVYGDTGKTSIMRFDVGRRQWVAL